MKKYYCDRCGKEVKKPTILATIRGAGVFVYHMHLCRSCWMDFKKERF